jgi:ligand-binding sensor domain-containing protein
LPVEKDLSSRQVTSIFQDSKGFIWIGAQDGLNLYNANSIKIFKHDVKNKNSIANNYIQNICEDESGNIWIATALTMVYSCTMTIKKYLRDLTFHHRMIITKGSGFYLAQYMRIKRANCG